METLQLEGIIGRMTRLSLITKCRLLKEVQVYTEHDISCLACKLKRKTFFISLVLALYVLGYVYQLKLVLMEDTLHGFNFTSRYIDKGISIEKSLNINI